MNFAGVQSITIPEGDVKRVAIGGVTVWTKPNPLPYDAEVEFVESTGTQYVDTGIAPRIDVAVSGRFSVVSSANWQMVFGSTQAGDLAKNNSIAISLRNPPSSTEISHITRFGGGFWSLPLGSIIYFSVDDTTLTINGTTKTKTASTSESTLDSMYVFRCRNTGIGGSIIGSASSRWYQLKIRMSGVLVRDFVPVRVGTVGYLYDRANPTGGPLGNGLYGSATATPLVAGPDKNGG